MSPQFRKVYRPPLLPVVLFCWSASCRFVLNDLWNVVACFQPPSLLIGKVWVSVMSFCGRYIHCKVYWRVGRRLGSCRLILVPHLIGSPIRAFSITSALWVLEVLRCPHRHSFYQTDHNWSVVSHVLCHIINLSLHSGILPDCLKLARVTPKGGASTNAGNCRTISVLLIFK